MKRKIVLLDEGWNYIFYGITKLMKILEGSLEEPFTPMEYLLLYSTAYNMCNQGSQYDYAGQLYDRYKKTIDDYIESKVLPSVTEKYDEYMLRELVIRWTTHKIMVRWFVRFLNYLDRFFVSRCRVPALNVVGLTCFRDLVYMQVIGYASDVVINLVNKEREGEQIDGPLLKNVVDMFAQIGMGNMDHYENDFEKKLLDATAIYYKHKAANWIKDDSFPDYMLKAEEYLKRERERVYRYLHSSTEQKLIEKVQHELLVTHANQLFENEHSGCHALLREGKVEDLSRMYKLYHKLTKHLEYIATIFKQHVTAEGRELVRKADDAAKNQTTSAAGSGAQVLVREFIELHDKYRAYVDECFGKHTLFQKALKGAFEVFCNKAVADISSAELLATFCDNILKKGGSENMSNEGIEYTLEKGIELLVYIDAKDLFAEFLGKKLARRLLFDRSGSDDHERSFLSKLKEQFGGQFTSKMEGMITDITLARDNQTNFEEYLRCNPYANPGIDLTVTVLTTGFWPCYKTLQLNLPSDMVKCLEVYRVYYEKEAKHRKLTWIYSLGSCNIVGKFESNSTELIVSTSQAAALLLFNKADRLSYSEILSELNVSPEDLVRLLHSLSCARYKILIKEPNTKSVSPNDSFEFNSKFTDRMRRIKIPLPTVDERKKIFEDVVIDRRYAIDAAIVRIMKSRKVLDHRQLVMECVEILSRMFKPDIRAIKKRIEDLVARDYLKRDEQDLNTFTYVA